MKKNLWRRMLAFIMVTAIVFSTIPQGAFAIGGSGKSAGEDGRPLYTYSLSAKETQDVAILWVDNNTTNRPSSDAVKAKIKTYFSVEGDDTEYEFTLENAKTLLHMTEAEYNAAAAIRKKANTGTYDVYELDAPTVLTTVKHEYVEDPEDPEAEPVDKKTTVTKKITWNLKQEDAEAGADYYLPVVKTEPVQAGDVSYNNVYAYREQSKNEFNVVIKQGDKTIENAAGLKDDLVLYAKINGTEYKLGTLDELNTKDAFSYVSEEGIPSAKVQIIDGQYVLSDLPKYDDEKIEIVYYVKLAEDDKKVAIADSNDYFSGSYNNDASPNFSSNMTQCHNGGSVVLTLTGETDYHATKLWLDNGAEGRPTSKFYLWRFTKKGTEANYQQASRSEQVINKETSLNGETDVETIEFENLPKYDPEGYEYVYLTREELADGRYQIVYLKGYEEEDGQVSGITEDTDASRGEGDKSIYDDGVIANRLTGTISIDWRKEWKAAHYQDKLSEVTVTFGIKCRMKGSDDEWKVIDQKAILDGFIAESLYREGTFSLPQYDELGRPMEYQFYEADISETGYTVTFDPETGEFSLKCNLNQPDGDEEHFVSHITTDANGNQTIINQLEGTTTYVVDKLWAQLDEDGKVIGYGKEAPEGATATVQLLQNGKPYTYTGSNAEYDKTSNVVLTDENGYTYSYTLPKYDADGKLYEYVAMEIAHTVPNSEKKWGSHTTYNVTDEEGNVIDCRITNAPVGNPSKYIWIQKDWKDDGNMPTRKPVTVEVYRVAMGDEEADRYVGTYTITAGESWRKKINVSEYKDETKEELIDGLDNAVYYIREVKIGDSAAVVYDCYGTAVELVNTTDGQHLAGIGAPVLYDGANKEAATVDRVTAGDQQYEAYYTAGSLEGLPMYTVVNRRIGYINYTIKKEWLDGNNENGNRPDNVAQLEVAADNRDGYSGSQITITDEEGKGIVTIAGVIGYDGKTSILDSEDAEISHTQKVSSADNVTYYFYNLPKYDAEGRILHYDVVEKNLPSPYVQEVKVSNYTVGTGVTVNDAASKTIVNKRSDVKDVQFHKLWKDEFAFQNGRRPDIYLTLYRKNNTTGEYEQVEPYPERSITMDAKEGDVDYGNYNWTYSFPNVPKYDSEGREIFYYVTEGSSADMAALEYAPVELQGEDSGNAEGYSDLAADQIDTISGKKLLPEDGRFVNKLVGNVVITGKKVWKNVPAGTSLADLPKLQIKVNRTTDDSLNNLEYDEKNVAVDTTLDLNSNYSGYECTFVISEDTNGTKLPKYDADGKIYYYTVEEAVVSDNLDHLASTTYEQLPGEVHDFVITNAYAADNNRNKNLGYLQVIKEWKGLSTTDLTKYQYPAVQFKLYRQYVSNDAALNVDHDMTAPVLVESLIVPSGTTTEIVRNFTTSKLLLYAPNGKPFYYYIEETILNGYDTTVNGLSGKTYRTDSFVLEGTTETSPAKKQFDNSYNPSEKIELTGIKKWNDYSNAFLSRPDALTVDVYRYADAQTIDRDTESEDADSAGAQLGTAIAEEKLTEDSDYTIVWKKNADNTWSYTISGLNRYAPNGTPWKYRVEETVPEVNGYYAVTKSVKAKKDADYSKDVAENSVNTIEMSNLENSFYTDAALTKNWPNDNNTTGQRPTMISVKLQYKLAGSDTWKDATAANFKSDSCAFEDGDTLPFAATFDITVDAEKDTTFKTSKNLPALINGKAVSWRFVETGIGAGKMPVTAVNDSTDGITYEVSGSYQPSQTWTAAGGTVLSNTLIDAEIVASKVWDDLENKYNTRPESVTVKLQCAIKTAGGTIQESDWKDVTDRATKKVLTAVLNEDNRWTHTFEDLRLNAKEQGSDGTDLIGTYYYRVVETDTPDGYVTTYQNTFPDTSVDDTVTYETEVTNSLSPQTTVVINKVWKDADGTDENADKVGTEVLFEIRKVVNGKQVSFETPMIVALDGNVDTDGPEKSAWTATITDLPTLTNTTYIAVEVKKVVNGSSVTYTDAAPDGYHKSGEADIAITDDSTDETPKYAATIQNDENYIRLNKLITGGGVIGTKYSVSYAIKQGNQVIAVWTKTFNGTDYTETLSDVASGYDLSIMKQAAAEGIYMPAKIAGLPIGTYTLVETSAPNGYETTKAVTFTIGKDGKTKVGTTAANDNLVLLYDEPIDIGFTKTDVSGNAITSTDASYAEFTVTGQFADETTTKTISTKPSAANSIASLKGLWIAGESYVFTETKAPNGYELATTTVTILVAANGTISVTSGAAIGSVSSNTTLKVKNTAIELKLDKYAIINSAKSTLAGAQFELKDVTDSASTPKTTITVGANGISLKGTDTAVPMIQGHTYTLTETKAPNGYLLPADADGTANLVITFTVQNDGTIKNASIAPSEFADGYLTAEDNGTTISLKNDPIQIELEKLGEEDDVLTGSQFTLTDTSAAGTPSKTITLTDGTITLTGEDETVPIIQNHVYKLTETAAPTGYTCRPDILIKIDEQGRIVQTGADALPTYTTADNSDEFAKLTVEDAKTELKLDKTDEDDLSIQSDELILSIYDSTNALVAVWKHKKNGNYLLSNLKAEWTGIVEFDETTGLIRGLPYGTYVLKETGTPSGYETSPDVTFTIAKDGALSVLKTSVAGSVRENDTVVMKDYDTDVKLNKVDSNLAAINAAAGYAEFTVRGVFKGNSEETTVTLSTDPSAANHISSLKGEWVIGNDYVFTEKKAPNGYVKANASVTVTIKADGSLAIKTDTKGFGKVDTTNTDTLLFKNNPIQITIKKVNGTAAALNGAQFKLTDLTTNQSKTVTVAANGLILKGTDTTVPLIQNHNYKLEETKAPNGYILPNPALTVTFTVTESGTIEAAEAGSYGAYVTANSGDKVITVKNDPIEVTLVKWDSRGYALTSNAFAFQITGTFADGSTSKTAHPGDKITNLIGGNTYTISETAAPGGYTKVTGVTFTVGTDGTVTTANAAASANNTTLTITNVYEAKGSFTPAGNKTLTGRDYLTGEKFTYQVLEGETIVATGENTANGAITFTKINYTLADVGQHTYTIGEVGGSKQGLTYDTNEYVVVVTVTDKGDGTLRVSANYGGKTVAFTNVYHAAGSFTPAGNKTFTGRDYLTGETFTYTVKEGTNTVATGMNTANGPITFTAITYTEADLGEHTYVITENRGNAGGVNYDDRSYTIKVTVTDNGDGTLTATAAAENPTVQFNNGYDAEGEFTPEGNKTLTGRDYLDGEKFTYQVLEGEVVVATGENTANGAITFTTITYDITNVGTHTYQIKEVAGTAGGLDYDETIYTVTVVVTDNTDGTLDVVSTYKKAGKIVSSADFTNVYTAEGSFTPEGNKELTGRDYLTGEKFTFTVYEGTTKISEASTTGGKKGQSLAIAFDSIEYTLADVGTHTYTIKESAGTAGGLDYDETIYTVTVVVTDNGDGTLTAAETYKKGEKIVDGADFTNVYTASGSFTPVGNKVLTGRDYLTGETFTFTVYEGETKISEATTTGGKKNQSLAIAFDSIEYTLAEVGTHTYTIKETRGTAGGVAYDEAVYTITVVVTDKGDGTLNVAASYTMSNAEAENADAASADFTNVYTAEGTFTPAGNKTLTGRDYLTGEKFTYQVLDGDTVVATGENTANGAITFTDITYTLEDLGQHTYTICEVNDNKSGITYDTNEYLVVVTVTDKKDGTLRVSANYGGKTVAFTNVYHAAGSFTPAGNKVLTGRDYLTGEKFTYQVLEGETIVATGENTANGAITFTTITYTEADLGTHTYQIKEVAGTAGGLDYDDTIYTVIVVVTDNGDGTLTVVETYKKGKEIVDGADFTNVYTASGSFTPVGNKVLTGRDYLTGETFTFTVYEGETKISEATTTGGKKNQSLAIAFDSIEYTLAEVGNHTYTIKETRGTAGGVAYDEAVYTVTVVVTDKGDGTLNVAASYKMSNAEAENADAASADFTNVYTAEGTFTPAGNKTLTGRDYLTGEKFTYQVLEGETIVATGENTANGAITFTKINYTLADVGQHTYTIGEVGGSKQGLTYDTNEYVVVVTVTDKGDGTLRVSANYGGKTVAFTNVYHAAGSFTPAGNKTFTGRDYLTGETFTYTVKEGTNTVATGMNTANGPITFTAITYTEADLGEHTYVITENRGNAGGVNYDDRSYTIKVTVTDNGDGTLTATAAAENPTVQFNNGYDAEGEFTPEGNKTLTGRDYLDGEKFTYQVLEGEVVVATGENTANGAITFTTITYDITNVGTHTYQIKEVAGTAGGLDYDETIYTVTVVVTDNTDGTLDVVSTYKKAGKIVSSADFTNVYTAEGSFTPEGNKELTGRDYLTGEKFTYQVLEGTTVVATGENTANGAITFTTITYTEADLGTHTYQIKEVAGTAGGLDYDETIYTVTVVVTDNGDGTLTVVETYKKGKEIVDGADFTNVYTASGSFTPVGNKVLTGRDYLTGETFTFTVYEGETKISEATTTGGKKDQSLAIAFDSIEYTLAEVGNHTYTIKETRGTAGGVAYDEAVYTVTVVVTDKGDGTLNVAASYKMSNAEAENADAASADFTNVYTAEGTFTPAGNKTLTGRDYLTGEKFTYQVLDGDTVVATGENTANGAITFTDITYTLEDLGQHTYTICEVNDNKSGITYDTNEYLVVVTVTDKKDGTLRVSANYGGKTVAFTNVYHAAGSFTPAGNKTFTGRDYLTGEKFTYQVLEGETIVATGENTANGAITFTTITYTEADLGTHTYQIKEVAGTAGGLDYDDTIYTVTVVVTDNGDGTLTAAKTYKKGEKIVDGADFTNVYTASGSFTPAGDKTFTGRDYLTGETFTYTVKEDDATVATGMNTVNGPITFTAITYTEADLGEHTYVITENIGTAGGVDYDDRSYTIKVIVTDNGDGTLTATAAAENPDVQFMNEYDAEGEFTPEGNKTLTGRDYLDGEKFTYQVLEGEVVVATGENTEDGAITFTTITYDITSVGTHTYQIKEVAGTAGGLDYDETIYTVTVVVTDNTDGTLDVVSTYKKAGKIVSSADFTNVYTAEGTFTPAGNKTFTGRDYLTGETFTYTVKEGTNTVATGMNTVNGPITFTAITYTEADLGEHTYVITENRGNAGGVNYDDRSYTIKVTVTDNGDGTLTATAAAENPTVQFNNGYDAEGEFTPEGNKTLTGRDYLDGEKFTYQVLEGEVVVATGENTEDGAITFTTITYDITNVGTHTYQIKEVAGTAGGLDYDETIYTVTVVVTDNTDGTLDVVSTYKKAGKIVSSADFTNVYTAEGSFTPEGNKELTGRDYLTGEKFTYQVLEGTTVVATGENTANGAITFTTITYTEADLGTHTYQIKEVAGTAGGLDYDETIYTVTVVVTDNGDGTLTVVETYKKGKEIVDGADFTNVYTASGSFTPVGNKVLTGRDYLTGETFTFTVYEGETKISEATTTGGKKDQSLAIAFDSIEYTLAEVGNHTYTIKETRGTAGGVAYDEAVYTVTVVVTDKGDGTLNVAASYTMSNAEAENADAASADFTNVYTAEGTFTPAGNKTLTGRDYLTGEKFTYQVLDGDTVVATGENTANGAITFTDITYTLEDLGQHTYTICEVNDNKSGITYDTNEYLVVVTVTDKKDGTLRVSANYGGKTVAFTNVYHAAGSFTPAGNKVLTGRDYLTGEKFTYQVLEETTVVATGENTANGAITFTTITYTEADLGTHTYQIKEVAGTAGGLDYDDTIYTVTVVVTDNGDGTLTAAKTYKKGEKIVDGADFTNVYTASGSFTPVGNKVLTGRDYLTGETFTFTVYEGETKISEATTTGGKKNQSLAIAFDSIEYTLAEVGNHTYTIKETRGTAGGVAYDEAVYTVTVVVTDKGDGTLNVAASYKMSNAEAENADAASADFTNVYTAEGTFTPAGNKTLTGRDYLTGEKFTYQVLEGETVVATGENTANGAITFTDITYTLEDLGQHTYTICEVNDNKSGITYDTNEYLVVVTVTDKKDGTLRVSANYGGKTVAFTNVYHAAGSFTPAGNKVLTGRDYLTGEKFTYQVLEGETIVATGENTANGAITFTTITYTEADLGTHTYQIKEVAGTAGGLDYDDTIYTVTVVVTDNGDGTLTAAKTYKKGEETVTGADFTNVYTASGSFTPAGDKTFTGRDYLTGETFTYTVKEDDATVATGMNTANGPITFTAITYTEADLGEHTYVITENIGTAGGVDYDDRSYTIKVTVTDNGDGTLTATAAAENPDVQFMNEYDAEGEFTPEGNKTLTGRDYLDGEKFTYQVLEGTTIVATGENTEDGAITFTTITYDITNVGTHTYQIKEVAGTAGGLDYDETIYTVTVVVTDNTDGTLDVVSTYKKGDATVSSADFTNVYTAAGSFTPEGNKELTGRDYLTGEKFTYQVLEGTTVVATGENTANGAITFTTITYTEADLGTHTYQIKEVAGTAGGLDYDETIYTVIVVVTDNGDGTLTAAETYKKGDVTVSSADFTNVYTAEGSFTPAGYKELNGRDYLTDEQFHYLVKEGDTIVATGTNGSDGKIIFTQIDYTNADLGTHTYIISEVKGNAGGLTYDSTVYTIVVTVTDQKDGSLKASSDTTADSIIFSNSYQSEGNITFSGTKLLTGRVLKAGEFEFEVYEVLTDASGHKTERLIQTVTHDAAGKILFEKISYAERDKGTHTYHIKEKAGTVAGITYDDRTFTVTVVVTDQNDGTISCKAEYEETVQFQNTYRTNNAVWTLEGTKILTGRNYLTGETFQYIVKEDSQVVAEGYSGEDGIIHFDSITYTMNDVGTHSYTVSEKKGEKAGITYDARTYSIIVKVTDNGDGTLSVKPAKSNPEVVFENEYHAVGEALANGEKIVNYNRLDAFHFTVYEDEACTTPVRSNVVENNIWSSKEDGTFAFRFQYTEEDLKDNGAYLDEKTYIYYLKETDTKANYEHDDAVYKITVTVQNDTEHAKLITSVQTEKKADDGYVSQNGSMQFVNTYLANGIITFEAGKVLTGNRVNPIQNEEFLFTAVLISGMGTEAQQSAAGYYDSTLQMAVFEQLTFTAQDIDHEFIYKITENAGTDTSIVYSTEAYYAKVTVQLPEVLSHDGDIVCNVTYYTDEACTVEADAVTFTNHYQANGSVTLEAKKTLTGRVLKAGEFRFRVLNADGEVLKEAVNAANGQVTFDDMVYTEADINQTYTYTIVEVKETLGGITYDESQYQVLVSILDQGDGTLTIQTTYLKGTEEVTTAEFSNAYAAEGSFTPEGTKELDGRDYEDGETFVFEVLEGEEIAATGMNTANGAITFESIHYTISDIGTHVYIIREVKGDDDKLVYDEKTYQVTVVVSDNGDGTLKTEVTYDEEIHFVNKAVDSGNSGDSDGQDQPTVTPPADNTPTGGATPPVDNPPAGSSTPVTGDTFPFLLFLGAPGCALLAFLMSFKKRRKMSK